MHVPLTPLRCLLRALDLYPEKVGVVDGETRITYAQFADRCRRIAAGLVANGVSPGDRVGVLSFNSSALLESYYAVPLAGAIIMPLNVRLHPSELETILRHAQPIALLYEHDFAPIVDQLRNAVPDCLFIAINDTPGHESRPEASRSPPPRPHSDARPYDHRRGSHHRALLHQRQHRRAQRRHAVSPHPLPARPLRSPPRSITTTATSFSTPFRSSTPTAGASRSSAICAASGTSCCGASTRPRSSDSSKKSASPTSSSYPLWPQRCSPVPNARNTISPASSTSSSAAQPPPQNSSPNSKPSFPTPVSPSAMA